MTKKVLILSSSYRKGGNSDTLCDQFAKGAAEARNEVEKIFVNDKNIAIAEAAAFATPPTNASSKTTWPKFSTRW